jgi:hypothetical protein
MMAAQEAPAGSDDWHLHFEFSPLNRSASQLKVRASVETATGFFINDTLPEAGAGALQRIEVPDLRLPRSALRTVVAGAEETRQRPRVAATLAPQSVTAGFENDDERAH